MVCIGAASCVLSVSFAPHEACAEQQAAGQAAAGQSWSVRWHTWCAAWPGQRQCVHDHASEQGKRRPQALAADAGRRGQRLGVRMHFVDSGARRCQLVQEDGHSGSAAFHAA